MEILILVAVIAILTAVSVMQNFQLRRAAKAEATAAAGSKPLHISEPTAANLEAKLTAAYEAKITEATQTFGTDLKATSVRLTEQVSRLTTTVIEEELEAYQATLEQVRKVATEAMEQIHQTVEQQRTELRQGMETDLAEEKKHLSEKFDAKMGDVISSYIAESLGSGVDLGAQMQFILTSLEAHKAEIRKDLLNGV